MLYVVCATHSLLLLLLLLLLHLRLDVGLEFFSGAAEPADFSTCCLSKEKNADRSCSAPSKMPEISLPWALT